MLDVITNKLITSKAGSTIELSEENTNSKVSPGSYIQINDRI
jgi:hypothetical protein